LDHFKCPSSPTVVLPNRILTVPIQQITEKPFSGTDELEKEKKKKQIEKLPLEVNNLLQPSAEDFDKKINGSVSDSKTLLEADDQDSVSQPPFFKENQFVDMKQLDTSPKSTTLPQTGDFKFDEKTKFDDQSTEIKNEDDEFNLWKMSLNGIGAICSFGVAAAATICIIALGGHQKNNKQLHHSQKLHFQFYTDDKQRVRGGGGGVPLTSSAHISFGGYYNNAL
jgi:hypothetical protein